MDMAFQQSHGGKRPIRIRRVVLQRATTFVALLAFVLCSACSGGGEAPSSNETPTPASAPSVAAPTNGPDACARAREIVRAKCAPHVMGLADTCSTSETRKVAIAVSLGTPEKRGPGVFVNFSNGSEWFLKDDGTLLTVNGTASGFCKELTNMIQYFGAQERASAPKRGDSPKTYEGVFDKKGNFLYETCSQYEIEVAAVYNRELFRDPDEPESKSTRRAARKVGLPLKVATDIYMKTTSQCVRAVHTSPVE